MTTPPPVDRVALRAQVYLRAVLPVTKIILAEKPFYAWLFKGVTAVVQIRVDNADVGAYFEFTDGQLEVKQGIHPNPQLCLAFDRIAAMNEFLAGKPVIPRIRGALRHPLLLVRTVALLLSLKILMPDALPSDPEGQRLKTKLVLNMITVALSRLNKEGLPEMRALTEKSPDRVYQWTVEELDMSVYVRMKAGKTKAGKGAYTRRRPFVHLVFPNVAGAFKVLTAQVDLVEAVKLGYVRTEGPPEFGREIGILMQKVEELLVNG